jgi:hypothetical protein
MSLGNIRYCQSIHFDHLLQVNKNTLIISPPNQQQMPSSDRNSSNSPGGGGGGDDDVVAVARIAPKIIDLIHQSMDATNNQESATKTTTTKPAVSLEYFPPRTVEGVQVRYINDHEMIVDRLSRVSFVHTQTHRKRERESLLFV